MRVQGEGLASEICALYLAGAGVGRIELLPSLTARCRALNGQVEVVSWPGDGRTDAPGARILDAQGQVIAEHEAPVGLGAVGAGAALARSVMEAIVRGG